MLLYRVDDAATYMDSWAPATFDDLGTDPDGQGSTLAADPPPDPLVVDAVTDNWFWRGEDRLWLRRPWYLWGETYDPVAPVLPMTWFGFRREMDAAAGLVTHLTDSVVASGDPQVRDLVAFGPHVYVLVRMIPEGTQVLAARDQFWLVTLRLQAPGDDSTLQDEYGPPLSWTEGLTDQVDIVTRVSTSYRVRGPAAEDVLVPIAATRLGASISDTSTAEPPTLAISPDGRYIAAMSGIWGAAGFWLIDVGMDSLNPNPIVVAGLSRDSAGVWQRWNPNPSAHSITEEYDQQDFAVPNERGLAEKYPVWPVLPVVDVDDPGQHALTVGGPIGTAAFAAVGSHLLLLLNTDPLTVFRVEGRPPASPSLVSNPLRFVGALCATGRMRATAASSGFIFHVGDDGGFAVPLCDSRGLGCCPEEE